MESLLAGQEDQLLNSLTFDLPQSINYIVERKSVSWYPSGSSEYAPNGVKVIKFNLTGQSNWLDPQTIRLKFRLMNKDDVNNYDLYLLNALPTNFFRRARLIVNGTVVEDVENFNLVCNLLHILKPAEARMNDAVEGFGLYDKQAGQLPSIGLDILNVSPVIHSGQSRVATCSLPFGVFNQNKKLPLSFLQNMQIELELVNNFTDVLVEQNTPIEPTEAGAQQNASTVWSIIEPVIEADIITLESQFNETYVSHLQKGMSIPIPFVSYYNSIQSAGGQSDPIITLTRSFSRLETIFVTYFKKLTYWTANRVKRNLEATHIPLKFCNYFAHPQYVFPYGSPSGTLNYQSTQPNYAVEQGYARQFQTEVEVQMQLGSKMIPEYPMRTSAECYYHLRKALGCEKPGSAYSINISERDYRSHKFIVAFDLKRESGVYGAGVSTKSGDLISIKTKNWKLVPNVNAALWADKPTYPDYVVCTMAYSGIMEISDQGVSVYE